MTYDQGQAKMAAQSKMASETQACQQQNIRASGTHRVTVPSACDYGLDSDASAKVRVSNTPSTELAADLYNLVDAQRRALHFADAIGVKIFGPVPEAGLNQAMDASEHLTAMVARARRQAEEIANRLEGISANI